jgi:cell division septation protein DedD
VTADEGFREIQLNGKQLVFLFMAAAVVLVVSFLCGVLVGRNARPSRTAETVSTAATVAPDPVSTPPQQSAAVPAQPPAEPPAPADELSYFDRLQKNDTPKEVLKSSSTASTSKSTASQATPASRAASQQRSPADARASAAASSTSEPPGPGFAVQVTTAADRQSAEALVKQLVKKGYPAYVGGPVTSGGKLIYRIRVGKYKTAKEADAVSKRLETEEQFTHAWIAR